MERFERLDGGIAWDAMREYFTPEQVTGTTLDGRVEILNEPKPSNPNHPGEALTRLEVIDYLEKAEWAVLGQRVPPALRAPLTEEEIAEWAGFPKVRRLREAIAIVDFWPSDLLRKLLLSFAPWHLLYEPTKSDESPNEWYGVFETSLKKRARWPSINECRGLMGKAPTHKRVKKGQGSLFEEGALGAGS